MLAVAKVLPTRSGYHSNVLVVCCKGIVNEKVERVLCQRKHVRHDKPSLQNKANPAPCAEIICEVATLKMLA